MALIDTFKMILHMVPHKCGIGGEMISARIDTETYNYLSKFSGDHKIPLADLERGGIALLVTALKRMEADEIDARVKASRRRWNGSKLYKVA